MVVICITDLEKLPKKNKIGLLMKQALDTSFSHILRRNWQFRKVLEGV